MFKIDSELREYIKMGGFVGLAQTNPIAGDLEYNSNKIITFISFENIYIYLKVYFRKLYMQAVCFLILDNSGYYQCSKYVLSHSRIIQLHWQFFDY